MELAQRFALDNIYCAPGQDKQFCFKMVRHTKPNIPVRRYVMIYNSLKHLPNQTSQFHVFALGNLPPIVINLLKQKQDWFRDSWINVAADMVMRNYILKIYNQQGQMFPREKVYYSFIDESSILVALESTGELTSRFNVKSFNYLSIYSNSYFTSPHFNSLAQRVGIDYRNNVVNDNLDKVRLQGYVDGYRSKGGDVFIYVNGMHVKEVRLDIPDGSMVEMVYDQSVLSRESYAIPSLRTFGSTMDSRTKFLLFRNSVASSIQYVDDTELYINSTQFILNKGLYFYKHKDYVMRNVTDKDFSIDAIYVNNTRQALNEALDQFVNTADITLYSRRSGRDMPLVYSSMKLHELYKLPASKQLDVINNTGYNTGMFRAETMESSSYFKVASLPKMSALDKFTAFETLGYNGVSYYFADTPNQVTKAYVDVPELYQTNSVVFEYDTDGKLFHTTSTSGPLYPVSSDAVKHVQFFKGSVPSYYVGYYEHNAVVTLKNPSSEIMVLSAYFVEGVKATEWVDITKTNKVSRLGDRLELLETEGYNVKVVYLDELNIYDEYLDLGIGVMYFPLAYLHGSSDLSAKKVADIYYRDIAIWLNKHRLTQGIDYVIDYPYVCIFSKKYIDYSLTRQELLIKCSGCTTNKASINELDINGFVNNGVLTRNRYYDLRDDRVIGVFVDGKLKSRSSVNYSETDNTVRLSHPLNGLPYTVEENFIPLRDITGVDTVDEYAKNIESNTKISALFNEILPEPEASEFNIIPTAHYLYSPTLSKIINDLVTGMIPQEVYSTNYNDNTITALLNANYAKYMKVDPVKMQLPETIVEIHPHVGNAVIELDLLAYRFVTNVIRLITNNRPQMINISGYLSLRT